MTTEDSSNMPETNGQEKETTNGQKLTVLSTIVVNSGDTNIVIALIKNKNTFELKIFDMKPVLIDIGKSLEEALTYQKQHDEALNKIETKQESVEKLFTQADDVIACQKGKPEVFSAMAESLNTAWKDLFIHLQKRKKLLSQAVAFYNRCKEFSKRIDESEKDVSSITSNASSKEISIWITKIYEHKKYILESSMFAMKEEQILLEMLNEIGEHNLNDARQNYQNNELKQMISYIQEYLEKIQEKRRQFELLLHSKRESLKILSSNPVLIKGLKEIKEKIQNEDKVLSLIDLGNTLDEAQTAQFKLSSIEKDLKEIGAKAIKLAHEGENLLEERSEELRNLAYSTLESYTNTLCKFERLKILIERSIQFFENSNECILRLNQFSQIISDNEVKRREMKEKDINSITKEVIENGRKILEEFKEIKASQGLEKKLKEIQKLSNELISMLSESQKENKNINNKLHETCQNFLKWLKENVTHFIQNHQSLGTSYSSAKEFFEKHKKVCHQFQTKQVEVNAFLTALNRNVQNIEKVENQVQEKADLLQVNWVNSNSFLEARILVSQKWLNFYRSFDQILKQINELENEVTSITLDDNLKKKVEERFVSIQQDSIKLNNICKNLIREIKEMKDPYLDKEEAVVCADDCLNQLELNSTKIKNLMKECKDKDADNKVKKTQFEKDRWNNLLLEVSQLQKQLEAIDTKLYPLITNDCNGIATLLSYLTNKQTMALHLITNLHSKVELLMNSIESIDCAQNSQSNKFQLIDQLHYEFQTLQKRQSDFKILCLMMTNYFQLILEIQNVIDNLDKDCEHSKIPLAWNEIKESLQRLEQIRSKILKLMDMAKQESQALIEKIIEIEPDELSSIDKEKIFPLITSLNDKFISVYDIQRERLDQQKLFFQYNQDLKSIYEQIEELGSQLKLMRGNFGSTLSATKATSFAFKQFEKTIELLEQKVKLFCTTLDKALSNSTIDSNLIQQDIIDLQQRWSVLSTNVVENRKLIDSLIAVHQINEDGEAWLEKSSKAIEKSFDKIECTNDPMQLNESSKEIENLLKSSTIDLKTVKVTTNLFNDAYKNEEVPEQLKQITNRAKEIYDLMKFMKDELKLTQEKILLHQQQLQKRSTKLKKQHQLYKQEQVLQIYEQKKGQQSSQIEHLQVPLKQSKNLELLPRKLAAPSAFITLEEAALKVAEILKNLIIEQAIKEVVSAKISKLNKNFSPNLEQQPFQNEKVFEKKEKFETKGLPAEVSDKVKMEKQSSCKTSLADSMNNVLDKSTIASNTNKIISDHSTTQLYSNHLKKRFDFPLNPCIKSDKIISTSLNQIENYKNNFQVSDDEAPSFIQAPNDVKLNSGQPLILKCRVKGKPTPKVDWMWNNVLLKVGPELKIAFQDNQSVIKIVKTTPQHSGNYIAIAKNSAGESLSSCKVIIVDSQAHSNSMLGPLSENLPQINLKTENVENEFKILDKESKINSNFAPLKILKPLNNTSVERRQKLFLTCDIIGIPTPVVSWYFNGNLILPNLNQEILQDGQSYSLTIHDMKLENQGKYTVKAINSVDQAESEAQVTVNLESMKTPQFLKFLEDKPVNNNKDVLLTCAVIGNPDPNVMWYFNDKIIDKHNVDQYVCTSSENTHTLLIKNISLGGHGKYCIVAENKIGKAVSSVNVLKPATKVFEPTHLVKKSLSPPSVNNKSTLKPYLQNFEKDLSEFSLIEQPLGQLQKSPNKKPEVHPFFEKSKSFDNSKTNNLQASSVHSSNVDPKPIGYPKFLKTLRNLIVKSGTEITVEVEVSGSPEPSVEWFYHDTLIKNDSNFKIFKIGRKHRLVIKKVSESNLTLKTKASNLHGSIECSAVLSANQNIDTNFVENLAQSLSNVSSVKQKKEFFNQIANKKVLIKERCLSLDRKAPPLIQHKPLKISDSFYNLNKANSNYCLKVSSSQPNIPTKSEISGEFLQNDSSSDFKPIWSPKNDNASRPKWRSVKAPLSIDTLSKNESFLYKDDKLSSPLSSTSFNNLSQCSISSPTTSHFSQEIKPIYKDLSFKLKAPVFISELKDVTIKEGDYLRLECQVDGYPFPSIRWFHNGHQLFLPTTNISSQTIGQIQQLTIEKAPINVAGNYICIATNASGNRSTQCYVTVLKS